MNIIKFIIFSALNIFLGWNVAIGAAIYYADSAGSPYGGKPNGWAGLLSAIGLIYIVIAPIFIYKNIFEKNVRLPSQETKLKKEKLILTLSLTFIAAYYLFGLLIVVFFSYLDIKGHPVDLKYGTVVNIVCVVMAIANTLFEYKRSRPSSQVAPTERSQDLDREPV